MRQKVLIELALAFVWIIQPVTAAAPIKPIPCSEESLVDLFPGEIMKEVLTQYGIALDKIDAIDRALENHIAQHDQTEEEAITVNKNASELKVVNELSDENLLKAFTSIMQANGTSDVSLINQMYKEIQDKRMGLLRKCLMTPPQQIP